MKLNVKTAEGGHNNFTFSPMSIVSMDFGRVQPIQCLETIAGGHYSASGNALVRVAPQVFPPFGRCSIKNATFFVPFNKIMLSADSFLTDNNNMNGLNNQIPYFDSWQLNAVFAFAPSAYALANRVGTSTNPPQSPYDFVAPFESNTYGYYRLTPRGEKAFALIKSLGYDFRNYNTTNTGSLSSMEQNGSYRCNAMPLLSYLKVYYDYFMSGVYQNTSTLGQFLTSVYTGRDFVNSGFTIYSESYHQLLAVSGGSTDVAGFWLSLFRDTLGVPYDSNFYNTAWNNPNSPTGNIIETKQLNDNTGSIISPISTPYGGLFRSTGSDTNVSTLQTIHRGESNSSRPSFSAYGHKMLTAVDRFVRRNGLAGSETYKRFMFMFGIKPTETHMSVKINESAQRMTFNAITSTAETAGASLGSFAGQGIGGLNIAYNYECSEYGYIITLAWLSVDPIKMRGISPACLRTAVLDFYHSDFDGKAIRPIVNAELRGGVGADDLAVGDNVVYGYTGQYDDYRFVPDVVAGSFIGEDARNFAFMRDFSKLHDQIKPQDLVVKQYKPTSFDDSLTNPFYTDSLNSDRFWFCVDWTIHASLPILSSEDSLDIDGSGSTAMVKNGDSGM